MKELLRCEGLTKLYGDVTALDGIDLCITNGKLIGILGPNGSGKTTLIKLINGLLKPTSGSIYVVGHKPDTYTRARVAYLPDNSYLNSWMTVEQIVEMFKDFYADFRPELAYKMLEQLGVSKTVKLKNLPRDLCLVKHEELLGIGSILTKDEKEVFKIITHL